VKQRKFSLASLKAGDRLLRAVKEKLREENQRIDYAKLRNQGFSERMIERLRQL